MIKPIKKVPLLIIGHLLNIKNDIEHTTSIKEFLIRYSKSFHSLEKT